MKIATEGPIRYAGTQHIILSHVDYIKVKKNDVNAASLVFAKMSQTIFLSRDYLDFVLADSVQHFNDGKKGHAGIFSKKYALSLVIIGPIGPSV